MVLAPKPAFEKLEVARHTSRLILFGCYNENKYYLSLGGEVVNLGNPHKLTPLAIFSVFVLAIPGLVVGQIVSFLYGLFLGGMFDGNLVDWATGGWFKIVFMAVIPNALSGMIGGIIGVRLTYLIKPLKQANYEIVAYAIATIVIALSALGIFVSLHRDGISIGIVENISNCIGIVIGLFVGSQSVRDAQRSLVARSAPAPTN